MSQSQLPTTPNLSTRLRQAAAGWLERLGAYLYRLGIHPDGLTLFGFLFTVAATVLAALNTAAAGKPGENGFTERLMCAIKEEAVDLSDYYDYADAYRHIGRFSLGQAVCICSAIGPCLFDPISGVFVPLAIPQELEIW